ncbi:LuxR C-terminal-related transcriptional regulator [Enterobacteriaceae bacterium H18W14]|uniref:helix-turn-helix transcriptional regulator n=1 Tax=Dryocola boscaweniae TaxID=2925397 RepID=UPI0022F0C250|nr:LuxR C-terminal-related transcriptional regulator [Dryocola boscaweniae]MCT4715784.1 LuxR C-terminal-related transcriptional regulator [Dryocola boscaweniae]
MKIFARDCFYRQGVMALLDKMSFDYTEQGIWVSDKVFLPFFIFPKNNVLAIYNNIIKQRIRSPAMVFCARQTIPFFQDIYFAERFYFVSLDAACDTVEKEIKDSINYYLTERPSEKVALCPYQRLTSREIEVVQYLLQGHKPSLISKNINISYRYISMYKRSAMCKLQVGTFTELYCKVKLLERVLLNESYKVEGRIVTEAILENK